MSAPGDSNLKSQKLLIVDPDEGFKRRLTTKSVKGTTIFFFENAAGARPLITDTQVKLDGVFISQDLSRRDWLESVQMMNQSRPDVALFNIVSGGNCWKLSEEEIKRYSVAKSVKKEAVNVREMVQAIEEFTSDFDKTAALQLRRTDEAVGEKVQGVLSDFFPIEIDLFISGAQCIFDVYMHLKANEKFVKILNALDHFEPEKISIFKKNGVDFLFIRQEAASTFMQYSNHISKKAIVSDGISMNMKEFIVLSQGQQTLKYISSNLGEESLKYAGQFAARTQTIVNDLKKLGPERFPDSFFGNLAQYEHSVAAVLLAGIIATKMSIASEKTLHIVTTAAFLHDLGLSEVEKKFLTEDISLFTPEEKALYVQHPSTGVKMLRTAGMTDGAVLQAVEQHHMRNRGLTFPDRPANAPINVVAGIVGIADEIARALGKLSLDWSSANNEGLLFYLEKHVFPNFSKQLVYAARDSLFSREVIRKSRVAINESES